MAQVDDKFNPSFQPDVPRDAGSARHIEPIQPQKVSTERVDQSYIGLGGEVLGNVIKVADESVKKSIENTTYAQVDTANTARLGTDLDAAGYDNTAPGQKKVVPEELHDQEAQISKLNKAYNTGAMPESQYYAFLYKKSQDMKDHYGLGYYGYIDEMFDRAASHLTLASKLDNVLRGEMKEAQASKNKDAAWAEQNDYWLSATLGPSWKKQLDSGQVSYEEAQQKVGNAKAIKLAKESAALDLANRKDVKEQAYDSFNFSAQSGTTGLDQRLSAMGAGRTEQQFWDEIQQAQTKYAGNPEYLKQMRIHFAQLRTSENQLLERELYEINPKTKQSWSDLMGPDGVEKQRKALNEKMDTYEKMLTDGQFGVFGMLVKAADTGIENRVAQIKESNKVVNAINVMDKSIPHFLETVAFNQPSFVSAAQGVTDLSKFMDIVDGTTDHIGFENSDAQPATIHSNMVENLNNPKIPDPIFLRMFDTATDPKSESFHANVNPNESSDTSKNEGLNKQKEISALINPQTVQRYYELTAGKGDVARWEEKKDEIIRTTGINLQQDVKNVQALMAAPGSSVDIRWNQETGTLNIVNAAQMSGWEKSRFAAGLKSLKAINTDIQQLVPMWKAEGQSDEQIQENLHKVVTDQLGIDPSTPHDAPWWAATFNQVQEFRHSGGPGKPLPGAPEGTPGFIQRTRSALMKAGLGDVPGNLSVVQGGKSQDYLGVKTYGLKSEAGDLALSNVIKYASILEEKRETGENETTIKHFQDRLDHSIKSAQDFFDRAYKDAGQTDEGVKEHNKWAEERRAELSIFKEDSDKLVKRRGLKVIPGGLDKLMGGLTLKPEKDRE